MSVGKCHLKNISVYLIIYILDMTRREEHTVLKRILHTVADYVRESDKLLYILCITAALYGSAAVLSSTYFVMGGARQFIMHILGLTVGLAAAVVISLFNYRSIIKLWLPIAVILVIPVLLTFVIGYAPAGTDDKAWLLIGGFSIQPAEFLKIAFIISFSMHLNRVGDGINKLRSIILLCIHGALPVLLIHFQGDDGTALVFAIMFLVMMFAAGLKTRYFAMAGGAVAVGIPIVYFFIMNEDQQSRIYAMLFPTEEDYLGVLWQQSRGRAALANGGIFGSGIFNGSLVQSGSIPEGYNDFIFSSIGEEFGLIGCAAVILLIAAICVRILKIGSRTTDKTGLIICSGVFGMLSAQTVINIAMNLSMMPVIGITLPFFSAGTSSLLTVVAAIGLVMSVYRHKTSGIIYLRDD